MQEFVTSQLFFWANHGPKGNLHKCDVKKKKKKPEAPSHCRSGTHLTLISSLTVPSVGFGSVPWLRRALTHSTARPVLPLVTEDNDLSHSSVLSHLDWAQGWSVRLCVSARWHACVIGRVRLQPLVCTHVPVVIQLRNRWLEPDKTGGSGLSCWHCFSLRLLFLVKEENSSNRMVQMEAQWLMAFLLRVKLSFGIWGNEPSVKNRKNRNTALEAWRHCWRAFFFFPEH